MYQLKEIIQWTVNFFVRVWVYYKQDKWITLGEKENCNQTENTNIDYCLQTKNDN